MKILIGIELWGVFSLKSFDVRKVPETAERKAAFIASLRQSSIIKEVQESNVNSWYSLTLTDNTIIISWILKSETLFQRES